MSTSRLDSASTVATTSNDPVGSAGVDARATPDRDSRGGVTGPAPGSGPSRDWFSNVVRGASYYSVAILVQRGLSILMLPFYTRYLTRTDYGIMEMLDFVATVAGVLVSVQLSTALFYYYHGAATESQQRLAIGTAFLGTVGSSLALGVLGLAGASTISRLVFHDENFRGLVCLTMLSLAASLIAEFGFSCLRLLDRAATFLTITLARTVINVGLNILFLAALGLGVATMPLSSFLTTTCLAAGFAWYLVRGSFATADLALLRRMFVYGIPLGFGLAGEVVLHFGDRIFLNRVGTLVDLGSYGIAYKIGMMVTAATSPFFNYWNAQMVAIVRRPGGVRHYARMATYLLGGLVLVVLSLAALIDPIMALLVAPSFRPAARLVPWLALAYLIRAMGTYWSNTFLLINRPALVAQVTWIGAGCCLAAYAALIPEFGVWGAVAATNLGFALMATFALWKGQRLFRVDYEYGRWSKLIACGCLSLLPRYGLGPASFAGQVGVGCSCIAAYPILLWAVGFFSPEEIAAVERVVTRRLGRIKSGGPPRRPGRDD